MVLVHLHDRAKFRRFAERKAQNLKKNCAYLDGIPFGDLELVLVKSEVAMGMEMESWVAEKPRLLSSASSGHESLDLGHSSKKGRSVWFSCLAVTKSLPKKERGSLWVFGSEAMVLSSRPLSVPNRG
jgi:hypothetical protein